MKPVSQHQIGRRIGGFAISETLYPPQLKQPRHTHEFATFSFVLTGKYLENYERRAELRCPSTIVFRPPQESHSVQFPNESVGILNVQFDSERLAQIRRYSGVLDSPAVCRTETIAWLGKRLHREFRRMDALSALAIEGLILEILVEAARGQSNPAERKVPRWLIGAEEFLRARFAENFTLSEVAAACGVHPVHLSRVFRRKFGYTIGEYVRNLRVEFASKQIVSTENPLSEIAQAAGFADQSHLNKTFKTVFGLTPAEHRKLFQRR